jgi:hypothetical protein
MTVKHDYGKEMRRGWYELALILVLVVNGAPHAETRMY